ncbi:hypothetical protein AWZ03_012616 [Drosophila navojoa]|uniref:Uncharacterized protein n=1 Tax=Drosophila navojoa TaxID=7232 RepID=A0A484AZD0_DRONA|nr:hypothetical protein AWZ03_012616 [Drosophila navojoa]
MEPNNENSAVPCPVKPNVQQFCTLEQLRSWIDSSPLAHKCLIIHMTNDLDQIVTGMEGVRQSGRDWEDDMLRPLFVTVSMLFLAYGPVEMQLNMCGLMHRVLGMMDTTDPMSVHGHVEYLLEELTKAGACVEANQLYLALGVVNCNANALPMGVCLLWAVIGRILTMEITMHRFREFKELAEALGKEAHFRLADMNINQLCELNILLESINRVFELVVLKNNERLKQAGYPDHFFQIRRVDLDSMASWANSVLYQVCPDDCWMNQVRNQVIRLVNLLTRIRLETPELIEFQPEPPKMFEVPVDTYSDLDD